MYLGSDDANRDSSAKKIEQTITDTIVPLRSLQEYIATIYYPLCACPPLNQLFQNIEPVNEQNLKIKLQPCSLQSFRKKYVNKNDQKNYVFLLYSGRMFLGKNKAAHTVENNHNNDKIKESTKRRKNSLFFTTLHHKSEAQSQDQQSQHCKKQQAIDNGISQLVKDKSVTQVKQNSFFSLTSFKKPAQPQNYTLLNFQTSQNTQDKCLYGVLRVSQKYGHQWYLNESKKYIFISNLLRKGKQQLSEGKLKFISRFFKQQRYRKGTTLLRENQHNQKMLIMSSGQCQYTKNFLSPMHLCQKQPCIRLANANAETVFGAQFLIYQFCGFSKIVTVTTQALIEKYYQEQSEQQIEGQQEQRIDQQHGHKHKKSPKKKKNSNKQQKVPIKKSTESQIIVPLHKSSINNFTITITSAYADFYYISIDRFKDICHNYAQQLPFSLRGIIQNNYVTLLRNLKEKIDLQIIKIRRNIQKTSEDRIMFQARMKSGQYGSQKNVFIDLSGTNNNSPDDQLSESIITENRLKIGQSQLVNINLKNSVTDISRKNRLQKKIQLALIQKKDPVDFKKKIEGLLKQKLNDVYNFSENSVSPNKDQKSNLQKLGKIFNSPNTARKTPEISSDKKQKIIEDLQQIFMNNDDAYRSQSINRQNGILSKKERILKKRYSQRNDNLIINQDSYDINKNKDFRIDLLRKGFTMEDLKKKFGSSQKTQTKRSLDMKEYSARMKNHYTQKINKANKIKEQFMTIRSQCQNCHCYDDLQTIYRSTGGFAKDIKSQTMRTGSVWRLSENQKDAKNKKKDQPLQKLHSKAKFISEKAISKYHHNEHIKNKRKGLISGFNKRRLSAPLLGNNI